MGGRLAIRRPLSKLLEYFLQLPGASNDDANVNRSELEQQAKIIQVPVEEWILVVLLHFDSHTRLETVNRMCGTIVSRRINMYGGCKTFLLPPLSIERTINAATDEGTISATDKYLGLE
jgi:hypothetical protein